MAVISFNIALNIQNGEMLPELAERAKDLRPVFEAIIDKWARDNQDKFDKSTGAESVGAAIDMPDVFWEALAESTIKGKRRHGYPDQIMVETGDLMHALTNPDGFFRAVSPDSAVFGAPMALEDELKVKYNWEKRPTIFLSTDDQRMIEKQVQDYLSLGEQWREILFARGMQNMNRKNEVARMDVEFAEAMAGQ